MSEQQEKRDRRKSGKWNMKEIVRITIVDSKNPFIRFLAKHT